MGKIKYLSFLLVIILFLSSCQNKEDKKESNNLELSDICQSLMGSNNYEEKIKYLPKVLYTDFDFSSIKDFDKTYHQEESFYNEMQTEYLLSYLYLNQLEEFKQEYVKHYYDYKGTELDDRVMDFCYVACSDVSVEQRDVIILALEQTAQKLSQNKGNEKQLISIYNTLYIIYDNYGETDKSEYYSQKSESIMESLKNNVKNKLVLVK